MIRAYVLGKVEPNSETKIVGSLKNLAGVKKADITFGQYDVVVSVEAKDETHLKNIITEKIRTMPGITSTLTLIAQPAAI